MQTMFTISHCYNEVNKWIITCWQVLFIADKDLFSCNIKHTMNVFSFSTLIIFHHALNLLSTLTQSFVLIYSKQDFLTSVFDKIHSFMLKILQINRLQFNQSSAALYCSTTYSAMFQTIVFLVFDHGNMAAFNKTFECLPPPSIHMHNQIEMLKQEAVVSREWL